MRAREFLGFVLAGGAATLVNYSVFLVLLILNVQYLVASAIGFLSGIGVSFTINRLYVFTNRTSSKASFVRYIAAYLVALTAQLFLLETLVQLGIRPEISNIVAILIVVVVNFFVVRKFVFGK